MPQEPDAQMNHDVPSISRRATEKLPETRENGEGRSASRDAPATMGEKMRLATKDHIEHIEHDGEMDWEERRLTGDGSPYLVGGFAASVGKEWKRAAHRGRFALPCGDACCG